MVALVSGPTGTYVRKYVRYPCVRAGYQRTEDVPVTDCILVTCEPVGAGPPTSRT